MKKIYIAIAAIVKNEENYIEEWIEYHRLLGIEKFYIYDNGSTDDTVAILQKYVVNEIVELDYVEGTDRQIETYDRILNRHRSDTFWIAFIDVDEFLYINNFEPHTDAIGRFLKEYEAYNGLEIYWKTFGTSDHMNMPDGYVIEKYTEVLPPDHNKNHVVKTIVQTERTKCNRLVHRFDYLDGKPAVDENKELLVDTSQKDERNPSEKISIHHYYTKSIKEFMDRSAKGKACSGGWKSDIGVFKGGISVMYGSVPEVNDDLVKYAKFLPEKEHKVRTIFFYGAGQFGNVALKHFMRKEKQGCELRGIIDKEKTGVLYGYEIFRPEILKEISDNIEIVITAHAAIAFDIQKELISGGINPDRLFWYAGWNEDSEADFIADCCTPCGFWNQNTLPYVEMHVTDVCNLKCKGCTHYSALFREDSLSYAERLSDIRLLRRKFSHVIEFRLLGGEPLLSEHLGDYIRTVRELFPHTKLEVLTNGLFLLKTEEELFRCMKENRATLFVTLYPANVETEKEVKSVLKKSGIWYSVGKTDRFNRPLSLAAENSIYQPLCISDGCINLRNGSIARCPSVMYVYKLNELFGLELPEEGIYSLDTALSANELYELMFKRIPLCDYCVKNEISWEKCGNEISLLDFVSRD